MQSQVGCYDFQSDPWNPDFNNQGMEGDGEREGEWKMLIEYILIFSIFRSSSPTLSSTLLSSSSNQPNIRLECMEANLKVQKAHKEESGPVVIQTRDQN